MTRRKGIHHSERPTRLGRYPRNLLQPRVALRVALALALCCAACGDSSLRSKAGTGGTPASGSAGGPDAGGFDGGRPTMDASGPVPPADAAAVDAASHTLDASTDASTDASADASANEALDFSSREITTMNAEVIVERVTYLSEGLRIVGQVCRPNPGGQHGPGPYPVAISNHGGFSGLGAGEWNGGNCVAQAENGWVLAQSSYRGEDGSEGQVEVCLGEVTDVLRLTDIVLAQPYADPGRVYMSGVSHGGCITTRAVQRGAPVQLAIDIFGPTDFAALYRDWVAGIAAGAPDRASLQLLKDALDSAVGGGPDMFESAYAARSPVSFGPDLDRAGLPYLHIQGGTDTLVSAAQGCALAAAGTGFQNFYVNVLGGVTAAAPPACADYGLPWQPGPRPSTSWPAQRYLMFYDDLGHGFDGLGANFMFPDMIAFLTARFMP